MDININVKEEIAKGTFTIIFFSAPYCKYCDLFTLIFEKVSQELFKTINDLNFIKLSVDTYIDFVNELNIESVPTIVFFKKGKEIYRINNFVQEEQFLADIKKFV